MTDTDRRPAGVSLAAVVLSLMTCFGVVGLIGSVGVLFFTRNPLVPKIASVRIILGSFDLLVLLFLVWCVWTVAGLFRLRSSARLSVIVIGVLDFLFFTALCATMLYARQSPIVIGMDGHPNPAMPFPLGTAITALAFFYGAFALIGLWWVVYFSLPAVRLVFVPTSENPDVGRPGLVR